MERASGECASLFLPIQLAFIVCRSGIIFFYIFCFIYIFFYTFIYIFFSKFNDNIRV